MLSVRLLYWLSNAARPLFLTVAFLPALFFSSLSQADESTEKADSNAQVIQSFTAEEKVTSDVVDIDDQTQRVVMFSMGVPLLVLLVITGALGIAMGIYGKQVFLAHMIFAGLSVTLAIAHAVVGIVWFYPF
jgi:hypothetical protein